MKAQLHDLRILKLAEMYEMAYEGFALEIAQRIVRDPLTREGLMPLVGPGDDHHGRIVSEMERLNAGLSPDDMADVELAALEDVVEVERAAREFYLRYADRVHDPRVAQLFRDLAREEDRHHRIARDVLAHARARAGRALPPGTLSVLGAADEEPPLREGATDFGRGGHLLPRAHPLED